MSASRIVQNELLFEFERVTAEERQLDQEPEAAPEIRLAFYEFYQRIYRKAISRVAGISSKEVLFSIDRNVNRSPLHRAQSVQQNQFPGEYQTSSFMEYAGMQVPNPPMPAGGSSEAAAQSHGYPPKSFQRIHSIFPPNNGDNIYNRQYDGSSALLSDAYACIENEYYPGFSAESIEGRMSQTILQQNMEPRHPYQPNWRRTPPKAFREASDGIQHCSSDSQQPFPMRSRDGQGPMISGAESNEEYR
jgi:hypothetical protein